jgi:hypothetical protein
MGTMRSTYVAGFFHPLSLAMLCLCVAAGLVAAWWLFPIGLVLWAVMVVNVSRLPLLRMSHKLRSRAPLAQRFQRYYDRIQRAQVSVFNSLSAAPAATRRALLPVQAEMDALVEQVYLLCQNMSTLENYRVVSDSQSEAQAELARIEEVLAQTDDPLLQKEYGESRYSLEQRLSRRDEISRQLDRVEGQLLSLANETDGAVAEVMRLQAMGAEQAAGQVAALVGRIRQQSADLAAFRGDVVQTESGA